MNTTLVMAAIRWLIFIAALFIVPRNRKPGSATAWLMLIALQPFVGAIFFLLIGSPKLSKSRRVQQRKANALIAARVDEVQDDPTLERIFDPPIPDRYLPIVRLNENLGGMPACVHNHVRVISDYAEAIHAMTASVNEATEFVHVQFYILALDDTTEEFFVALENAVARGVPVRLLVDHMASRRFPRRKEMTKRLTRAGVDWRWTLPFRPLAYGWNRPDLRNHRKMLIVDGSTAYTGSMNMIDSTYLRRRNRRKGREYVEVVAELTGPIAVELNAVFLIDWVSENGTPVEIDPSAETRSAPKWKGSALCQVLPSGPGYDDDNNLKLFTSLIYMARRKLFITTPYFVPDDSLMTAITSAAQRGVDVTLLTGAINNQFFVQHAQHSYYEQLLRAGVKIALLKEPALLHAKHMSIDDEIAVIGSSNLDMRSFTLNLEITLVAYDAGVVDALRGVEAAFLGRSDVVELNEWQKRPHIAKLVDNLARLTAALQ